MSRAEGPEPVYVLPVLDKWLLHAPLHRVTALVNAAAVAGLRSRADGAERLAELRAALESEPEAEPRPREGPARPQFLGLLPTRACNLRCVYCGFGAAQAAGSHMDPELAVAAVDWMAEEVQRSGGRTLDVHFFGGEPLAAPEVVEVAVHRTRAAARERDLTARLEVATNGVYSEERAQWVGDYFDWVVLSLDGPAAVHDRQRPALGGRGSFEQVTRTARLLARSTAELSLRVTVTADNVTQLAETVRRFAAEFQPSTIDLETLQPTPESERASLRPPEPYLFAAHYWRAGRAAAQRGTRVTCSAAVLEAPRATFCPVGNDALIVSPEGRVSACYLPENEWQARGLDLNVGWFRDGTMLVEADSLARVRGLLAGRPRCRNCFCRWSCAGGCPVNHSYPGCPDAYDDFCLQTRVVTACELLGRLKADPLADKLVEDPVAMERLAGRPSDRLQDWEAAHA